MYKIGYQAEAAVELGGLRAFDRVRILDAIGKCLSEAPAEERGQKKQLDLGGGDFVWQLRVGDYRVFYDVIAEKRLVIVRHVRRKGRKTTGEIL